MSNFDKAVSGELITKVVSTDVVEFKESTILQAISAGGELNFLTEQLREKVATFEHDMSTGVGRRRSASFAHNISKAKVKVVNYAKASIAEDEAKIKKVKASLKTVASDFDDLRDIARLPLTEWEAENAKREAEEAARIEAEKLALKIENDHEFALMRNDIIDRDKAEAKVEADRIAKEAAEKAAQEAKELAAKQEAERIERDARIAKEAAYKAIAEAEAKAKAEAERVEREKREALEREEAIKLQAAESERARIAAVERAKIEAEQAETRRIEAEAKAKRDALEAAENARLAEVKRQEDEAARVKAEDEKREANRRHVGEIRRAAKEAIMREAACDEHTAKKFIIAIHAGLIPNISIKY